MTNSSGSMTMTVRSTKSMTSLTVSGGMTNSSGSMTMTVRSTKSMTSLTVSGGMTNSSGSMTMTVRSTESMASGDMTMTLSRGTVTMGRVNSVRNTKSMTSVALAMRTKFHSFMLGSCNNS